MKNGLEKNNILYKYYILPVSVFPAHLSCGHVFSYFQTDTECICYQHVLSCRQTDLKKKSVKYNVLLGLLEDLFLIWKLYT